MKKNEVPSEAPKNYLPNLVRVSSLVEFKFPFIGNKKDRFLNWLREKGIQLADYMEEACSGGTYVHKAMEDYGDGKKPNLRKYSNIIKNGIRFHVEHNVKTIASELYIRCKEYQGTIDRIATMDGDDETIWIIDFKTWSLAKAKYGITSIYKKPYDKLVKAKLQLSLYKRALLKTKEYKGKTVRLAIAELNEDNYYLYPLEEVPNSEILQLIKEYNLRYSDEL